MIAAADAAPGMKKGQHKDREKYTSSLEKSAQVS